MAKNTQPISTEKYEGPNQVEAGFGKSSVDSSIGTLVGAGVGALAGMAALKVKPSMFGKFAKHTGAVIGLSAAAGSILIGSITSITGLFSGMKKADRGREQFELMKAERNQVAAERDMAVAQVAGLEKQVEVLHEQVKSHKFTDTIQSRASHGSHTAAHESNKEAAQSDEHTR